MFAELPVLLRVGEGVGEAGAPARLDRVGLVRLQPQRIGARLAGRWCRGSASRSRGTGKPNGGPQIAPAREEAAVRRAGCRAGRRSRRGCARARTSPRCSSAPMRLRMPRLSWSEYGVFSLLFSRSISRPAPLAADQRGEHAPGRRSSGPTRGSGAGARVRGGVEEVGVARERCLRRLELQVVEQVAVVRAADSRRTSRAADRRSRSNEKPTRGCHAPVKLLRLLPVLM